MLSSSDSVIVYTPFAYVGSHVRHRHVFHPECVLSSVLGGVFARTWLRWTLCSSRKDSSIISAEHHAPGYNTYSGHLWAAKVCGVPVCHVHRFSFGRAMSRNIVIGLAIKTICCAICEEH
jgi:hypothetical protein